MPAVTEREKEEGRGDKEGGRGTRGRGVEGNIKGHEILTHQQCGTSSTCTRGEGGGMDVLRGIKYFK